MKVPKYILQYGSINFYITDTTSIKSMEYTLSRCIAQSNRFREEYPEDVKLVTSDFNGDHTKIQQMIFDTHDDIEKYFIMYD